MANGFGNSWVDITEEDVERLWEDPFWSKITDARETVVDLISLSV